MIKTVITGLLIMVFGCGIVSADATGLGASGGVLIPIIQDDQKSGHTFEFKARFKFLGPIAMEPTVSFSSLGNKEITGVGIRDGFAITHYGLDLTLGGGLGDAGFRPYFLLGGGVYNLKRDGDETSNKSGWSFGAGSTFGLGLVELDVRGRLIIISTDNSGSKKAAGITAGVTYYFGRE